MSSLNCRARCARFLHDRTARDSIQLQTEHATVEWIVGDRRGASVQQPPVQGVIHHDRLSQR
jgi:hypothetical protein